MEPSESSDDDLNQLLEISINHKGVDLIAVVSLEQANILMNDEAAASEYAEALLTQQVPGNLENEPLQNCNDGQEDSRSQCSKKNTDNFTTREATLLFLSLRKQYNDKFNDRKTLKNSLWGKIAVEMRNNGYNVPDGREGAEKCRQKFANLQRNYMNFIKHVKTTGTERREPPPYFDEINEILGNKDKVSPPYLEDSLGPSGLSMDVEDEPTASCSSSSSTFSDKVKDVKNRFSSHSSVRPTTNFNKVMEIIKEQNEQLRKDKEKHMNILEDAIKVQNEQRERFLKFLENTEKRKRDHNSNSSDE